MFVISKLLQALLSPSNLVGLVVVLTVAAALFRRRRLASALSVLAAIGFITIGWLPVGRAALRVLENRFPSPTLPASVDGIVMIGGAVDVHLTQNRGQPSLTEAGERVTETLALMQRYPDARVILSGGGSDVTLETALSEAAVAKAALVSMGAPAVRLELEEHSKTTCENAIESAKIANPAAGAVWLLVTSASQMPRAVACFRTARFAVLPYPVDYRSKGSFSDDAKVVGASEGFAEADLAAHEWFGLVTYRLAGATTELFPGPDH